MNFDIKLGATLPLKGATGRTFEIVPSHGNIKDDEVYKRGLALELELKNQLAQTSTKPNPQF
jgi:hypothetical protein